MAPKMVNSAPGMRLAAMAAFFWAALLSAQEKPRNLVANSSFEVLNPADGRPMGFVIGKDAGALAVVDEKEMHGGSRSIKIISGDNPKAAVRIYYRTKAAEIVAGKSYTCSVWSKLNIGEKLQSPNGQAVMLRVRCLDAENREIQRRAGARISKDIKTPHDWQRHSCTILAPEGARHIQIDVGAHGAMLEAWVDDLQLEEGNAPTGFQMTK